MERTQLLLMEMLLLLRHTEYRLIAMLPTKKKKKKGVHSVELLVLQNTHYSVLVVRIHFELVSCSWV